MLRILDLYSGIGGFSKAFEDVSSEHFKTHAFCEIDKYAQLVLKKHWPLTPIFEDVRTLPSAMFRHRIEIICGGYPCTGHSVAGKKEGLNNEASGLWSEYRRIIEDVKPRYVIIENSHNLRSTGLVDVLRDISSLGYNIEWSIISAYSVGAPHQRERIYIVAWRKDVPYCDPFRSWNANSEKAKTKQEWWTGGRIKRSDLFEQARTIEPKFLRVNDGIPDGLHANHERIKQLGNSIVPLIVEEIAKRILENEIENNAN